MDVSIHSFIHGCFNWMMNQIFILGRWLETTKHPWKTGCLEFLLLEKKHKYSRVSFTAFFRSKDAFQKARLSFDGTLGGVFSFYKCLPMCFTFHSNFTPITGWVYSTRHFADTYKCAIVSSVREMIYYIHKRAASVIWFILKILQISIIRFQYNYKLYVYILKLICNTYMYI